MTGAEKEIWRAAYASAFVADVASMAQHLNTSMAVVLERPGAMYHTAEAARSIADAAVLGLRETEEHHATKLSREATNG